MIGPSGSGVVLTASVVSSSSDPGNPVDMNFASNF